MKIGFYSITEPLYDAMDTGGGGGSLLSDGSTSTDGQAAPGFGSSNDDGGGNAIELSDDTLIRVKGSDKPVKYSEYIKNGFVAKSDFTRAQQAKAQEAQAARQQLAEAQTRLTAFEQRQQGNAQPQANPIGDLVKSLEGKPYLSGSEAAGLVKQVWEGGVMKLAGAITQRDEVIKLLYNRVMQIDKGVTGLRGQSQEQGLQARFAQVKSELNLPNTPEVDEFIQDVYYSHEGEDLDAELPNMVRARWTALQNLIRTESQKQVRNARTSVLAPGGARGGNATPSNGLRNKTSRMDARQLADEMWPLLGGPNT